MRQHGRKSSDLLNRQVEMTGKALSAARCPVTYASSGSFPYQGLATVSVSVVAAPS